MAYNTAIVMAHLNDVPVVLSSPQEIKMAVAGKRTASKSKMAAELTGAFPDAGRCSRTWRTASKSTRSMRWGRLWRRWIVT